MPEILLRPVAANRAVSSSPTQRLGNSVERLLVDDTEAVGHLKFPEHEPARGHDIVVAEIRLQPVPVGTEWSTARTLAAQPHERWDYRTISFNSRPAVLAGTSEKTVTASGTGQKTINVRDHIQAWSDGLIDLEGFKISTTSTTALRLGGMGDQYAAGLYIRWNDPSLPPSNLSPDGGVTELTKPEVSWEGADPVAAQVQFGTVNESTGVFTATWDSGWVTTQVSSLDLAATSYPGASGTVYWRVRIEPADSPVTEWSEVASWTVVAKPTLTLAPLSSTPDYSPARAWTVSTQVAARVRRNGAVTDRLVAESEILGPSVRLYEPDIGARFVGQQFTDTIESLDRWDRLDLPGAPAWQSVSDTWTYDTSDVAPIITDVRFEQEWDPNLGRLPWGRIIISATEAPEAFIIHRGDLPAITVDADSSGSSYLGNLTWGIPTMLWPANTFKDVSIITVLGATRLAPFRTSLKADVTGLWLVHADSYADKTFVTLDGTSGAGWAQEDVVNEYQLRSGKTAIHRTGRTGKNGTISGQITRKGGLSIEAQHEQWKALADLAEQGKEIRVIGLRDNFRAHMHSFDAIGDAEWASTNDVPLNVIAQVRGIDQDA